MIAQITGFLIVFGAGMWVLLPLFRSRAVPSAGYCSECGGRLEAEAQFCAECGTRAAR